MTPNKNYWFWEGDKVFWSESPFQIRWVPEARNNDPTPRSFQAEMFPSPLTLLGPLTMSYSPGLNLVWDEAINSVVNMSNSTSNLALGTTADFLVIDDPQREGTTQ